MTYAYDKVKQRFFQQSRDVALRLMILSGHFSNVWDFIHVHYICKFQEHPIKIERVTQSGGGGT